MSTIFQLKKDFMIITIKYLILWVDFQIYYFKIIMKIAININKIITCNYGDIAYLLQLIQN